MKAISDLDKCGFCRVLGMEAEWKEVKREEEVSSTVITHTVSGSFPWGGGSWEIGL